MRSDKDLDRVTHIITALIAVQASGGHIDARELVATAYAVYDELIEQTLAKAQNES